MRRVVVTGSGALSPLGDSPSEIHRALSAGEAGFADVQGFELEGVEVSLAGEVQFDPREYLGRRNFRPVDRTGQMVIIAALRALEASGWHQEQLAEHGVGLVLGTMFGSVHTISAFDRRGLEAGPKYVKPLDFANSVINAAAGQTAIWHGLRGINSTVAGGLTAGIQASAQAFELIRTGRADALLAGGGEELCFESFVACHNAGLLSAGEMARPYDQRRDGFLLGEGAALYMLEEASAAEARGAQPRAEILGHASFFDPSRGRDPEQAALALQRACQLALKDAGVSARQIDVVSAGGNGSPTGDLHEALGLATVFADHRPLICAVRSSLGESLGAGGAFQILTLLGAMEQGTLPGIHGFEQVDSALPDLAWSATSQNCDLRYGMATALGLDGNATALVLGRAGAEST